MKIQGDGRIQHIGWPTGIVGLLLFLSLGLELLAHQVFGKTDLGTLLWALYLDAWSFVLGTLGFLLLAVRWFVEWRHIRASQGVNGPERNLNELWSVDFSRARSTNE
ncbi:MAG: hypothetical protein P0119_20720 [Nitrospira sp.]|nr:hypothetical protein [Nitrospira sp.]